MWVVFRKSDKQVVGSTVDTGVERSKEEALNDVLRGLGGKPNVSEFDAVEVKDRTKLGSLNRALSEGRIKVKDVGGGRLDVEDDTPEAATVRITTNAAQVHPVDEVPLIPGDGQSFLVVTLQKVNQEHGAPLGRTGTDNEEIWLRTSHGTLREDKDDNPQVIRSVRLVSGTARFRLYSDAAKRLAVVQMLSANAALRLGGLQVEFI